MLFKSWDFLIFFLLVGGLYFCLPWRKQNVLLLLSSYFFYGWWDWRFTSLLAISTTVDFLVARRMQGRENQAGRKRLLLVSIATNLGILGFFKYFNFFVDSMTVLLENIGLEANAPFLSIVLPVGISFYTFQSMAYTIDVYRGKIKAVDDPVAFAVYVSYFPQLVAGPIERAQNLLPQFMARRQVTMDQLSSGAFLILIGLVRKVVIADNAAAEVDIVFTNPEGMSSLMIARGIFLFALQIYGDFAGYSAIARGTSRILGIELIENFSQPYFSTSITEFWRRWHISLSSWLRDYLYIPLGGNRHGKVKTYRNLMLTMLLGGLWHGAAWTFVFWGFIHGAALAGHKALFGRNPEAPRASGPGLLRALRNLAAWALTMTVVGLAWVFFRATSFESAVETLVGLFSFRGGWSTKLVILPAWLLLLVLFIDVPQFRRKNQCAMLNWPWPVKGVCYALLVLVLVAYRSPTDVPFIYFQF